MPKGIFGAPWTKSSNSFILISVSAGQRPMGTEITGDPNLAGSEDTKLLGRTIASRVSVLKSTCYSEGGGEIYLAGVVGPQFGGKC